MATSEYGLNEVIMELRCDIHLMQLLVDELILQSPNPQRLLRQLAANIEKMTVNAKPSDHLEEEYLVRMRARMAQMLQRYQV